MLSFFVFKQKTAYEMLRSFVGKQKTAYEMLRSLVGSEMCIRDYVYPIRLRAEQINIARNINVRYFYILFCDKLNLRGNLWLQSLESCGTSCVCVLKKRIYAAKRVSDFVINSVFID